jgi:hypothetical protein
MATRPHKASPTVAGPVKAAGRKQQGTEALAAAFPSNAAKASEFGAAAQRPARGQSVAAPDPAVSASTRSIACAPTPVVRS